MILVFDWLSIELVFNHLIINQIRNKKEFAWLLDYWKFLSKNRQISRIIEENVLKC